jgi:hypothetical protein
MSVPEITIESAIERLKSSPGTFQRLVEYYASLTYPHRFKNLVPQGRNPNDVTVKGWPDIYARSADGRMDVVEVTHSPAWLTHLEEDLEKAEALGKEQLAGFLFVAWDDEPSPLTDHKKINPRFEKLNSSRDRLVALDIPSDSIHFIFKKKLVRDLAQAKFASVLKEILGLPCHSLPFRVIHDSQLFGLATRLGAFAPTKEEYHGGLVHRADLVDVAKQRLEHSGWAWIRGRGAAGKTVLAIRFTTST